jgi:hypothetical protein
MGAATVSLKLLARDLYRCQREVERLECALESAPPETKRTIEEALRRARAERNQMRRVLDGQIGR